MSNNLSGAAAPAFETDLGARHLEGDRSAFRVWAPLARSLDLEVYGPRPLVAPMAPAAAGYFEITLDDAPPGSLYKYRLNGHAYPDPVSRCQPEGVHGPSQVIDNRFHWTDGEWTGNSIDKHIIYEIHVGTFTSEGTFAGAIGVLPHLKELGVTAVEIMPVAQFPGARNWGYDGVYPYSVQPSYGGVDGLKRFVDAAHHAGIAVILDVVYNHLGPEGNYLSQYGPYFTDRYHTPWGQAVNFDGPDAAAVRHYFIQNALWWVKEFHIDGLRLDAVHAIFDASPRHILEELAEAVHSYGNESGRIINVIAESDLNDARLVRSVESGGYGLDGQWSDDFHHALHARLTNESDGYYKDFTAPGDLASALSRGFVYAGQYSAYRGSHHGSDCSDVPGHRFVVCAQNHDQIGNRMLGERLNHLVTFDDLKLAASVLLLSPYIPLLFMGQEYGEKAPFLYFVSHTDPALVQAVREGRRREFSAFSWRGEVPDPQAEETFARSRLDHNVRRDGIHRTLFAYHKELIRMRNAIAALARPDRERTRVDSVANDSVLVMRRWSDSEQALVIVHFGAATIDATLPAIPAMWTRLLDSAAARWRGPGSMMPVAVSSSDQLSLRLQPKQCIVLSAPLP
jgi:maltooligosyltrehalose trehalohydrolase